MKKIVILVLFIALLLSSCFLDTETTKTIKYEVTGTANTASITMRNKDGNTEQISSVTIPWETTFSVKLNLEGYDAFFAYISAQNNGQTGSVTSKIFVNGNEFQTATSSGAYVIATASGSVKP